VFEENLLVAKHIDAAKRNFDALVTGTTWCREALEQAGCTNVRTVLQGVDPRLFNPHLNEKEFYRDQFVVFSGGKMELRKGQDIVIRAVAVLQQRHKDVMLINQWYNGYPASLQTMAASPLIRWQLNTSDYFQFLNQLLADNGVDLSRVISLGPQLNTTVSRVYKNTDVGLFPNRCEGATNLVMNEYMACGKPVVASFNTGHKDVLSEHNSVRVMSNTPFTYQRDGVPVATWEEPSLEETIERLEWAYQNRDALKQIGRRGAEDQQKLSWRKAAEGFLEILQKGA
jgi:glycosyltransferase involved in cell wall biosynthesis